MLPWAFICACISGCGCGDVVNVTAIDAVAWWICVCVVFVVLVVILFLVTVAVMVL